MSVYVDDAFTAWSAGGVARLVADSDAELVAFAVDRLALSASSSINCRRCREFRLTLGERAVAVHLGAVSGIPEGFRSRRMTSRVRGVVMPLVLCLLVASCSSGASPAPPGQVSAPAGPHVTKDPSPAQGSTDDPDSGYGSVDDLTSSPTTKPTWDDQVDASAARTAQEVMVAFARPNLTPESWFAGVQPHLAPEVQEDYRYVDPANISPTKVVGAPKVVRTSSSDLARVSVPTDAGVWVVVLSRTASGGRWLVVDLISPDRDTPVPGATR